jgi:hypothetical protein
MAGFFQTGGKFLAQIGEVRFATALPASFGLLFFSQLVMVRCAEALHQLAPRSAAVVKRPRQEVEFGPHRPVVTAVLRHHITVRLVLLCNIRVRRELAGECVGGCVVACSLYDVRWVGEGGGSE